MGSKSVVAAIATGVMVLIAGCGNTRIEQGSAAGARAAADLAATRSADPEVEADQKAEVEQLQKILGRLQ